MQLYDGESSIYWAHRGLLTKEQMADVPQYEQLLSQPSVLFDNGAGVVYDWRLLSVLCAEWGVQATEDAEADFEALQAAMAAPKPKVYDTDPQVATIAKLTASSIDFEAVSATDCVAIPDYVPEWEPGIKLGKNAPVMRNGQLYRASQAIESAQEQYPPETAGESLYYPVYVDEDGIIIYRECHGEYDMVRKGEKRHYPGAGDPVYIALEDTAYSPDTYPQHWKLVG